MPQSSDQHDDKGFYEWPVWVQMETAINNYTQDRKEYVEAKIKELGPDAERQWQRLQEMSDTLVKGVGELADIDITECLRELLSPSAFEGRLEGVVELLVEHVDVTLSWEAMVMLHSGRERFVGLSLHLRPLDPSYRSRAFLKRVSRCYLFGFDAECVVMCRSVLESEFEAVIANNVCVGLLGMPDYKERDGQPLFQLYERITVAERTGRIDKVTADLAHRVRYAGRDAVHRWPKAKRDALDVVADTIRVLDALAQASA